MPPLKISTNTWNTCPKYAGFHDRWYIELQLGNGEGMGHFLRVQGAICLPVQRCRISNGPLHLCQGRIGWQRSVPQIVVA